MVTQSINDRLGPGGLTSVAVYSEDSSGNIIGLETQGRTIPIANAIHNQLLTAVCGNSIAEQCKKVGAGLDNSYWSFKNTIHHANTLSKSPMKFERVTATLRSDGYGVYGYGGQTLTTINSDILVQWLAQFTVTPELVIGYGLLENSIGAGHSVATMQNDLNTWIKLVQYSFPGAIIILCTPHPSFSYNTPALVSAYQAIRDYTLSLDNGVSIFTSRMDAYENPVSPATPLGTTGSPIYTDSSVHPNAKGAFLLARALAATLNRFISNPKRPQRVISNNLILSGTQAATGTNNTGTMPTGAESGGTPAATAVLLAEQPGWLITSTAVLAGFQDLGTKSSSWGPATGTQLSPCAEVEIVSGAENIGVIELFPSYYDGITSFYLYPLYFNTGDGYPDYQNGDILTIVAPPEITTHLAFTLVNPYIRVHPNASCPIGGTFSYRIKSLGCSTIV